MKLKLVVASMSVLGLISCPVSADTHTTQTHHKKVHHNSHHHGKKHHNRHHHVVKNQTAATDYKQMGSLPVQPAPVMEVMPKNDPLMGIYEAMGQNSGCAKPMPDWFNRVGISGGANLDAHWGNRSKGYAGENNKRISINDAYLNATATVNDWTHAFASFSFNNSSAALGGAVPFVAGMTTPKAGTYSQAYANGSNNQSLALEQAYVSFANFDESPLFVQAGKQYEDFGRYTIHPITRSMTQSMSETLRTSVNAGFLTRTGFHGSLYAFDNSLQPGYLNTVGTVSAQSHAKTVYGAALGYDQVNDQLGFNMGVGYLSNMTGVNDVNYAVGVFNKTGNSGAYIHSVGAVSVYGNVNSGPFSLGAHYVSALTRFNPYDLSNRYQTTVAGANGAKPWSADITAGFGFTNFSYGLNTMGKNQNVYGGYSASNNAVNLFLPKSRWTVGYNVDMWTHANVGLEVNRDNDYGRGVGGSNRSSNTIAARAAVKFG